MVVYGMVFGWFKIGLSWFVEFVATSRRFKKIVDLILLMSTNRKNN